MKTTATLRLINHPGPVSSAATRYSIKQLVRLWMQRARTRRQLATLLPHELADIGVDATSARIESSKPFWQE